MACEVKILCDSIAPNGVRLTTWELKYWRAIHAELLTHRQFSKNSGSSRAIPTAKLIQQIINDPAGPVSWGVNKAGMQAGGEMAGWRRKAAISIFMNLRWVAILAAWTLNKLGVHKQIVNRVLEPWMYITVVLSSTKWENFYNLRCHKDAQPEIQELAYKIRDLHQANKPTLNAFWHLPYITTAEAVAFNWDIKPLRKISVARCARVSYLTHGANKVDYEKDFKLHDQLAVSGHWSPFEHVATPLDSADKTSGNFHGWKQYREIAEMRTKLELVP